MNRDEMMLEMKKMPEWDVIIIGGGATGLGTAVDASSRGFKTLLLEQIDFAKGTSSRSTKLIHGGLRYLQQGNIALVIEALKERGLLCENAPDLVHHQPFLVPIYHWWEGPFYGIGLKVYDMLAGELGLEPSRHLSRRETLAAIPNLEKKGLRGGFIYYDGQFDDSRLAIALAQTAREHGATLLNYMKVTSFIKKNGLVVGVKATDLEKGKQFAIKGKVVINATGVFSDHMRHLDDKRATSIIAPSQGIHIVLPKSFLRSKDAILVPHTEDKRVIFLVPWHDRVLLGTTDTPVKKAVLEPQALQKEVKFLLKHAARYLAKDPTEKDILSIFAGLRPLVKTGNAKDTASLARDHVILVSRSGLITIAGGKWTTYRKMAQDVIDKAIFVGHLSQRACATKTLPLHVVKAKSSRSLKKRLHARLPYTLAQVVWAVKNEMARTVEDVLARRTRSLLLDAKASIEAAPKVAKIMAKELKKSKTWQKQQITEYTHVAEKYLPHPSR